MVKPVAAAVAGSLLSGVAMYAVGTKTAKVDAIPPAFTASALVETVDGGLVPAGQVTYPSGFRPAAHVVRAAETSAPVIERTSVERARPAYRVVESPAPAPAPRETVEVREAPAKRSWKKTAIVIGGSSAAGAGIGAITGGKKGALIGAAIGGGAASIYEATRRK
jgi:hypothetical protein